MARQRPSVDVPFSIDDFHEKLRTFTVEPEKKDGWQGRPFIRSAALTSWLKSSAITTNTVSHAALLLGQVFPDRDHPLPISDVDILSGGKKCPLMFSILLELEHGGLVYDFHKYGMHDAFLPKPHNDLLRHFRGALPRWESHQVTDLAKAFYDKQWKYFPQPLSNNMRPLPLEAQTRLPICQCSKINGKGGTAEIYMISVPEDFVDAELKRTISHSEFYHTEFGTCYQFALKNFPNQSLDLFEAEIYAYHQLQKQKHVVKCLGAFSHFEDGRNDRTHSILLEYGDCDLSEYFCWFDPPVLPEDIEWFWSQLFNVIRAVKGIHIYEATRGGQVESYHGWHGDFKPDNILMAERQLKLADPGFVNWVRSSDNKDKNGVPCVLNGWTSTYGPPEVNETNSAVQEPWAVDIWSIGCVLSEAATWIVLGESGRAAYSKVRQEATMTSTLQKGQTSSMDNDLGSSDFFHNGKEVLSDVKNWHQLVLRPMIRPNDKITKHVLDLIDQGLLVSQPDKRMRAEVLCSEFRKIQTSAEQDRADNTIPEHFKVLMQQARLQNLQTWTSISQTFEGPSIEERKAYNATTSAMFSHLSRRSQASKQPRHRMMNSTALSVLTESDVVDSFVTAEPAPTSSQFTIPRSLQRTSTGFSALNSDENSQSVFDAYYERKGMEASPWDKLRKKSKKGKDILLSKYYAKRDILFLVDNASSMAQYWSEAKFTLSVLVGKARNVDEDGLDLKFTRSTIEVTGAREDAVIRFMKAMDSKEVKPDTSVTTNMAETLGSLFSKWLTDFKKDPGSTRKLTIIVLTDGQWYSSSDSDEYEVDHTIIAFCKAARDLPHFSLEKRRVSVQFVSFGSNPACLARLQRLDDRMKSHGIEDIVDTEPSTGDIYQMLLGSFNPEFDERNTVESPQEISPTPARPSSSYFVSPLHSGDSSSSPRISRHFNTVPRMMNDDSQHNPSLIQARPVSQRNLRDATTAESSRRSRFGSLRFGSS